MVPVLVDCAAGFGATLGSQLPPSCSPGTTSSPIILLGQTQACSTCPAGTYNMGNSTSACRACMCPPPPQCRISLNCSAVNGTCATQLVPARSACAVNRTAGMCSTTGGCVLNSKQRWLTVILTLWVDPFQGLPPTVARTQCLHLLGG